jgi:hypothetical protein
LVLQGGEDRGELLELGSGERDQIEAPPVEESELQKQSGTQLPDVGRRGGQPTFDCGLAGSGRSEAHSGGTTVSGLRPHGLDQPGRLELGKGAVDDRSANSPDLSEVAVGGEFLGDGEAVSWMFGQQRQDGPLGE